MIRFDWLKLIKGSHTTPHHNRSKISPNISFGGASVFTVVTTSTLLLLCWILVWRDILLLLSHFYLGINSANTAFQFCTHTNWRPGNEKNSKQLLKIFPHAMVVVATAQSEPRDVIHWEQDLTDSVWVWAPALPCINTRPSLLLLLLLARTLSVPAFGPRHLL